MSIKVLHFADAHIDIITGGKRDPKSGFSYRTLDFLKALDRIVDSAIDEKVDLVLFAGDAYRDAVPVPTFQREWGKRMMRLSEAKIPVLLIAGNHDSSTASGRASALQEYDTLSVPYLHLAKTISLWTPEMLDGVPVQVIAVPWIPRSRLVAATQSIGKETESTGQDLAYQISTEINRILDETDPSLPIILMAHYSITGALFSEFQMAALGQEVLLPEGVMKDRRISYTALGHIDKFQDLNAGNQPPVVYPGSIERVNFGECNDKKGFVIAQIDNRHSSYTFRELEGRNFFSNEITIQNAETFQQEALAALPEADQIPDAMIRLIIHYPREWENFLDERELRKAAESALAFHLVLRPISSPRIRLSEDAAVSSLSHLELLERYCESNKYDKNALPGLLNLAKQIFNDVDMGISEGSET